MLSTHLENNALKNPLNEGQASRSVRHLKPSSVPTRVQELPVTWEAVQGPRAEMKSARGNPLGAVLSLGAEAVPFLGPERRCPEPRC